MAVIAAYMDESGTHVTAPVCVVAGYVGTAEQWVSLVDSWQKALHLPEFNVTEFHATECWAQQGEFSEWSLGKRQSLVRELMSVVLNHRVYGFAQAIDANAYRKYFVPVCDKKIQNPYFLCLLNAASEALSVVDKKFCPSDDLNVFAGNHQQFKLMGQTLYQHVRAIVPNGMRLSQDLMYGSPLKWVQLQVADLLSHHCFKDFIPDDSGDPWVRGAVYAATEDLKPSGVSANFADESFVRMLAMRWQDPQFGATKNAIS
jgi:hypothetical protein